MIKKCSPSKNKQINTVKIKTPEYHIEAKNPRNHMQRANIMLFRC